MANCDIGHRLLPILSISPWRIRGRGPLAVALGSSDERAEIARNRERQAFARSPARAKMWRQKIGEINAEAQIIRDAIKRIHRLASRRANRRRGTRLERLQSLRALVPRLRPLAAQHLRGRLAFANGRVLLEEFGDQT